jgi:hypothetical protein
MLKDIDFKKPEHIAIAIVPEGTEGETMWTVYLFNTSQEKLNDVLVNSRGYGHLNGREVKTATLRWFIGDVDAGQVCKIEEMPEDVGQLNNEFWVSYYVNGHIFDKKYIFLIDSLQEAHLTDIPVLPVKGVLIR